MSRKLFLDAVVSKPTSRPAIGTGTSIATQELMEQTGAYFPEAHLDSETMTRLAIAGHTILGYDVVMPLFSVWHESAAMGCPVDWGRKDLMPDCRVHSWKSADDAKVDRIFLDKEPAQIPLRAISMLKKELGEDCAVCGKVFGPWTLGYHMFGVENFLIMAISEPAQTRKAIEALKQITIWYAEAQIDAGVDCILLGDHATRDLCGPDMYKDYLMPVHAELKEAIKCPIILHICGDTKDRIGYIRKSGVDCFHWDTKCGPSSQMRELAGDELSLMGGISNLGALREGTVEDVKEQAHQAATAGINIVGPECAVPLDVKVENLKAVSAAVKSA